MIHPAKGLTDAIRDTIPTAYSTSPPYTGSHIIPNYLSSPVVSCIKNIMQHNIGSISPRCTSPRNTSTRSTSPLEWLSIIDPPPTESLSKLEVARDIRRILLDDNVGFCNGSEYHDNTVDYGTEDDFHSPDNLYHKPCVQFVKDGADDICPGEIDIIDLPISLGILYQVTREVHQSRAPCVNMCAMLEGIASFTREGRCDRTVDEYRAKHDACYRLYMLSKEPSEKLIKKREEQKVILGSKLEEEDKHCTFHPDLTISGISKDRERLSVDQFIQKCYEWNKKKMKKIVEKREQAIRDEDEAIEDTKLKMTATTKAILDRRAARIKREKEEGLMVEAVEAGRKKEILLTGISPKPSANKSSLLILEKTTRNDTEEQNRVKSPDRKSDDHDGIRDDGIRDDVVIAETDNVSLARDNKQDIHELTEAGGCSELLERNLSNTDRSTVKDCEDNREVDGYVENYHVENEEASLHVCVPGETPSREISSPKIGPHSSLGPTKKISQPIFTTLRTEMNTKPRAPSDPRIYPTFRPVTGKQESQERYFEMLLKRLEGGLSADDEDEDEQRVEINDTIKRLTDDVGARILRHEERCKEYKRRQKEQMYDPCTGQRLFQPNSMPTLLIDNKRVSIDKLPPYDRSEAIKALKRKHLHYLVNCASNKKGHQIRDITDFLRNSAEMQLKAQRRIEKIRRLDEKELDGLFVPKIDLNSKNIVACRTHDKIYQREVPKKIIPTPVEKGISDGKAIDSMLERQEEWKARRKAHISRCEEQKKIEEMNGCTFSPNICKNSSQKYADAAEHRLMTEVAMLKARQQSETMMQNQSSSQRPVGFSHRINAQFNRPSQHPRASNNNSPQGEYRPVNDDIISHAPTDYNANSQCIWPPNSRVIPISSHGTIREEHRSVMSNDKVNHSGLRHNSSRSIDLLSNNAGGVHTSTSLTSKTLTADYDDDSLINDWEELDKLTDSILQKVGN